MAGSFAVLSLACFSMVYYFTSPEVERLVKALKSHALGHWFEANFSNWDAIWPSLMFLGATLASSFVGFMSGIIAKVLHDHAKESFKSGIVT